MVVERETLSGSAASRSSLFNTTLSFAAGGLAGVLAKTAIAPLDRLKIIFQISAMPFSFRALVAEARRAVAEEGMRALFRGNLAQVLRVYPYSGVQLAAYDRFAAALAARHAGGGGGVDVSSLGSGSGGGGGGGAAHHYKPMAARERLRAWEKLLAGAAAGAASVMATYPLDLVRARLAVQMAQPPPGAAAAAEGAVRSYASLPAALAEMRAEAVSVGPAALFRGMLPTLLGILPYAGLAFFTFESCKQAYADAHGGREPGTAHKLAFGGLAGLIGQVATYPLDVVRRRMQTDGFSRIHAHATGSGPPPEGMLHTGARIVAAEGLRGLFKGVSLNFVKGPIAAGVSFTVFDALKKMGDID